MGVTLERNKFRVRVSKDGERHNIGLFDTELKAKRAFNKWKRENRTDPIQELYQLEDNGNDFLGRTPKKTIRERVVNAYHAIRSNAGTKK